MSRRTFRSAACARTTSGRRDQASGPARFVRDALEQREYDPCLRNGKGLIRHGGNGMVRAARARPAAPKHEGRRGKSRSLARYQRAGQNIAGRTGAPKQDGNPDRDGRQGCVPVAPAHPPDLSCRHRMVRFRSGCTTRLKRCRPAWPRAVSTGAATEAWSQEDGRTLRLRGKLSIAHGRDPAARCLAHLPALAAPLRASPLALHVRPLSPQRPPAGRRNAGRSRRVERHAPRA
jgi:hypothetical protein